MLVAEGPVPVSPTPVAHRGQRAGKAAFGRDLPDYVCRLTKRFEWRYTPKHGSWLDMAESELAVLSTQCLSRRIPNKHTLEKEVAAPIPICKRMNSCVFICRL